MDPASRKPRVLAKITELRELVVERLSVDTRADAFENVIDHLDQNTLQVLEDMVDITEKSEAGLERALTLFLQTEAGGRSTGGGSIEEITAALESTNLDQHQATFIPRDYWNFLAIPLHFCQRILPAVAVSSSAVLCILR
jgi:hypothetical protein